MIISIASRSNISISERDIELLRALELVENGCPPRIRNAAVGDLRFIAQLLCRAEARNQPLPASLETLGLDVGDVGPILVLAKKLEDA